MEGQNDCNNPGKTLVMPPKPEVPTWMWGIVTFIIVQWQWLRTV
jgi:hypothetical protein